MSHLKKYPTTTDVRALVTDEWLDNQVAAVPSYNQTESIFAFTGEITPDILNILASLLAVVRALYPTAKMGHDFSVTRKKSRSELEEEVLSREASTRYYHPENYPEYTDEDIAD